VQVLVELAQGLLALAFLAAGFTKLAGTEEQSRMFQGRFQFSLGFMRLVGALELLGALGLVAGLGLPVVAVLAALGLALLMIGALLTHARVHDLPQTRMPAVVLLVLCCLVLIGRLGLGG